MRWRLLGAMQDATDTAVHWAQVQEEDDERELMRSTPLGNADVCSGTGSEEREPKTKANFNTGGLSVFPNSVSSSSHF